MNPKDNHARLTGLLYLAMAITSAFGLKAMEAFEAAGSVDTIIAHIQARRLIFELSIVASAASGVIYLALALALYRLFSPIGKIAASLLLIFVIAGVPVSLAAVARQMDILSFIDGGQLGITYRAGAAHLPALSGDELRTQTTLALYNYDNLLRLSCIFWGLWLVPFGWLMFKAGGVAPRILGVLLVLGGFGYTLGFVRPVLMPSHDNALLDQILFVTLGAPALACELGSMAWLLIMGAPGRTRTQAPSTPSRQ